MNRTQLACNLFGTLVNIATDFVMIQIAGSGFAIASGLDLRLLAIWKSKVPIFRSIADTCSKSQIADRTSSIHKIQFAKFSAVPLSTDIQFRWCELSVRKCRFQFARVLSGCRRGGLSLRGLAVMTETAITAQTATLASLSFILKDNQKEGRVPSRTAKTVKTHHEDYPP